jgi:EpsI family protein
MTLWGPRLHGAALCALMLAATLVSHWLRPTTHLADQLAPIDLESQIPQSFGSWQLDTRNGARLVNPQAQSLLDKLYSQVLARTYVDSGTGERVMLSIAYGSDQSDAMQVHLPEVCYPAQGFEVIGRSSNVIATGLREVPTKRLLTRMGSRIEPLTYWTTIGDTVAIGDSGRKLAQLRYSLQGLVPDGLIFRVSSIDARTEQAWQTQAAFIAALSASLTPSIRSRLLGE